MRVLGLADFQPVFRVWEKGEKMRRAKRVFSWLLVAAVLTGSWALGEEDLIGETVKR